MDLTEIDITGADPVDLTDTQETQLSDFFDGVADALDADEFNDLAQGPGPAFIIETDDVG